MPPQHRNTGSYIKTNKQTNRQTKNTFMFSISIDNSLHFLGCSMSRMKRLKIRLDVLGGPLENKCLKLGAESTTYTINLPSFQVL